MFYLILLALTVFPFIFLNVTTKASNYYSRINQVILYIWLITYLFFIIFSNIYFFSFSAILLLISPLVLQFIFKQYKDSYLLQELNITFNNFKKNFFIRGMLVGLITILSYILFIKFNYLNYGIYLTFIILIILFFNVQNSLNKNFGLYFILVTFWGFISTTGNLQTNLLLVLISLFIPLIPLSSYKPFTQNTYLHIFSFLIYLCIYEILKDIDVNLITSFLMRFTITISVILLGISLLFSFEKKIVKCRNYFVPLVYLIILFLIKHYIDFPDQLISTAFDNLIITLSFITFLRTYGVVLADIYNYKINKNSESLYKSSKEVFVNWMGEALGQDIWNLLLGIPSKNKFSKYNKIIVIIILVLLWIIIKIQFNNLTFSVNFEHFPWEIIYILLSLQLINALLTIRAWFVVHSFINEKASNQLTIRIFISLLTILISIIVQYWELFIKFNKWILIILAILYFISLMICFINLSVDLINYREKGNFNNFKTALSPLMMLISITITLLAFHFKINIIDFIFIFLSVICLGLGLISGKLSDSIFAISRIVVKKVHVLIILTIMLLIIIYVKEMIFIFLYYIGYYTTNLANTNKQEISKK
ncbi:hypothetical protein [Metabacillus fastidiosus]|uniref:hypothetical protein n=1 Tax=Metabacillus fastidiosus TaxID=1458 RepID=UPI003D2E146A